MCTMYCVMCTALNSPLVTTGMQQVGVQFGVQCRTDGRGTSTASSTRRPATTGMRFRLTNTKCPLGLFYSNEKRADIFWSAFPFHCASRFLAPTRRWHP